MKKILGTALVLLLFVPIAYAQDLKPISEFEGGKLYQAGKINVVVMKGDFHQMGRQYGALLKDNFKEFYDMMVKQTGIGTEKAPYDEILADSKAGLETVPFYVREWVRGMGETSGLGADKQVIFTEALTALLMSGSSCSGMIAWDQYSKDGSTVVGRNWDLGTKAIEPYQKFMTVAVFNPTGYGQGVADINYLGQIMWQSGLNQSGLFYDLQNGGMCDSTSAKNRLNSNSALMSMLLDSTSFKQVEAFFDGVRAQGGLLIIAADAKQGACFEWATSDYRKRVDDEKGLVTSANNFTDPTWPTMTYIPEGEHGGFTKERTNNLLAMGKKYKGQIDADRMMKIFSTTIPEGGPTFPEEGSLKTYYSIVAVPKELKLWLNVHGLQDWTEIDLKPLFE
ncbi:MAG: C45 family autoproteolytic acyltransferase/hydrolase [Candidatus Saganbacteria bacterium]|nr:C45 family autoproteolytic acyltransferase/hydrolase [Candidatus Saganbacteria bacterium]